MGTDQGGVRPGPLAISTDVAIVGAGAAGLATAIFTRRLTTALDVVLLDGAKHTGAKILVSGGTRCNITNRSVRETDYWTDGSRAAIRRILRALPVDATIAWFEELGVHMHEEAGGKLFPDSNRARDVLQALLREVSRTGASVYEGTRVLDVAARDGAFTVHTARGTVRATSVVLATGGRSLPKTGSDGTGYALAQRLGHTLVSTCPALAPLVLRAGASPHAALSGIAHDVELAVWIDGRIAERFSGAMLWTHFGVSGPVALDSSRHWERAVLDGRDVRITMNACAGRSHEALDRDLVTRAATRPKASLASAIGDFVPAAVAQALIREARLEPALTLAGLTRDARRQLAHTLTAWELPVVGSRGFTHAEATAGGVKLDEIDPKTMESRICPGLYLVGEVLDVDGRLGGFNFQWAWASARVAAGGLAARAPEHRTRDALHRAT